MPDAKQQCTDAIAHALASQPWNAAALAQALRKLAGGSRQWIAPLAKRLTTALPRRPRPQVLAAVLLSDRDFQTAVRRSKRLKHLLIADLPAQMDATGEAANWIVPAITSPGELAELLDIPLTDLWNFADHSVNYSGDARRWHYNWKWHPKRSGGMRLVEAPKRRLKQIQRKLLTQVFNLIPIHKAAHGFAPCRSIRTAMAPHAGQRMLVRLDLADFFTSVHSARVSSLLRTAGYPESVARLLTSLVTIATPPRVWEGFRTSGSGCDYFQQRDLYRRTHLPQGAPTSPALANLIAFRLDRRLSGLAQTHDANYTRYADDLIFSGGAAFQHRVKRFIQHASQIAYEEGFIANPRKTRIMPQSVRQRALGVVINTRPNTSREDYDRLKAILHNCVKHGPHTQNRQAHQDFRRHLQGCISHHTMLNPQRGAKLQKAFEHIIW